MVLFLQEAHCSLKKKQNNEPKINHALGVPYCRNYRLWAKRKT